MRYETTLPRFIESGPAGTEARAGLQTPRLVPQESMRTSFGGPRFCAAMPSVNPRLTFTASGRAIDAEPLMIYRDAQLEDRSLPARPCRRGWQARTTRKIISIPWSRPATTWPGRFTSRPICQPCRFRSTLNQEPGTVPLRQRRLPHPAHRLGPGGRGRPVHRAHYRERIHQL